LVNMTISSSSHFPANDSLILLYGWALIRQVYTPIFFTHSWADGHLVCFHLLAVVSSAAIHKGRQVSLLYTDLCSFGYAEEPDFHSGCANLHSHHNV
jgi:hypothetical protein